jgi:nucleotide-binding universal stress UspA family protein
MQQEGQHNLLVATDFSQRAAMALDYSSALARKEGYLLFVLHVFNPETNHGYTADEIAYGQARRMLEDLTDEYSSKYFIEIRSLLETGNIFSTINETASRINAHLLVLPLQPKLGIQNLIGRFAFRIIATSEVPVVLLQNSSQHTGFDRVLVPLDLSRPYEYNLERAIEFGKEFNSTIIIASVTEVKSAWHYFQQNWLLSKIKRQVENKGLQCEVKLIKKHALSVYRHLLDYRRKINADAIFMLSRSYDEHDPLFIGGTAGRVIENADAPVIVKTPIIKTTNNKKPLPLLLKKLANSFFSHLL